MKCTVIDREEAKKITGWTKDMDQEYKGVVPGYACGYNFEVTKDGRTDFASCTFEYDTPDDVLDGFYGEFLYDVRCTPTGRVIFRGYYREEYDPHERDVYFIRENPFNN
jgi:hypothetical protein